MKNWSLWRRSWRAISRLARPSTIATTAFPFENIARLKETGYTALVIPEANGGLGADLEDYVLCQEQLAQGCGATTIAINMHLFGLGSMVERSAVQRPEQELFLDAIGHGKQIIGGGISEPETGGDWGLLRDQARKDGDSYVLNGRKTFHQPLAGDRFVHGDGDPRGFQSAARLRRFSFPRARRDWS